MVDKLSNRLYNTHMDSREILNFGERHYEVWDYWGNRLFEAETLEECEDWLCDNPSEDEE
jgi:hypothetical protein